MDDKNQNLETPIPNQIFGEVIRPSNNPVQNTAVPSPQQITETSQQFAQSGPPSSIEVPTPVVAYGAMQLPVNNISAPKKSSFKVTVIVIATLSLLFLVFFFAILPKLVTKNAANHAFDSQKQQQKQAGPIEYKLSSKPVKFGTATAASLLLPDGWRVDTRTGASSVAAYGPIDYVNGMSEPSIDANESSSYSGKVNSDISTYKSLHTDDQLLSEKTSTIAGLPATILEYKVANMLGQKTGTPPQNYDHKFAVFIDNNSYTYNIHVTYDERQNDVLRPLFNQLIQSFAYK